MASGKSTVGRQVSLELAIPHIDLDDYIEKKLKKSISDIFKDEGEIFFRLKENEYLKELLNNEDNFVLSLGGGTPCYANNMELIIDSKNNKSFYLKNSLSIIYNRLIKEKDERPIVARISKEELKEFIAKHLFERSFFYEKASYKINGNDRSLNEISMEISNYFK